MNQSKTHNFLIQNVSRFAWCWCQNKKIIKKERRLKKYLICYGIYLKVLLIDQMYKRLDKLEIGKITTIKVQVIKYNFPRIRNLPNKVICEDEKGKIDIVFF